MYATAPRRLLTAEEVSRRLNLRLHRVYELSRAGHLPHVRLGSKQLRYDPEAIEELIRSGGTRQDAEG